MNVDYFDNELYRKGYINKNNKEYNEFWLKIRNNKEILKDAIKLVRNKWDNGDLVKGLAICDAMLVDYENVDKDIYNELIKQIYTNTDIARIVINGAANGGFSFLLMSLWNYNLKLTEEQKAFAVNEAMNKIGTVRWKQKRAEFSKKLDNLGVTDDNTGIIDMDGCINPIGQKTGSLYFNYLFASLSEQQAHGTGAFDIRYHILKNPNWTIYEKQKLVMDFWYNNKVYDEYLDLWEWDIINTYANYNGGSTEILFKEDLYEYTYQSLLEICKDKTITDNIWNEIQFCKQMHDLRPMQWEKEYINKKKILITN